MAKKKSKPKKMNGVSKPNGVKHNGVATKSNGVHKPNGVTVEPVALVTTTPAYGPPPVDPSIGRFRKMKQGMEAEIREFKEYLVAKYTDFEGHDLRKDVAWYMEQMGTSIASDLERLKREERQRLIADNQAKEKLAEQLLLDGAKK